MALIENEPDVKISMLYWLTAASGMRAGEVTGLGKPDVLVGEGRIKITHSVWHGHRKKPKSRSSQRQFCIGPSLMAALVKIMDMTPDDPEGFVFQTANGTPLLGDDIVRDHLKPLMKKLGIADMDAGLHAFRHTVGTEWSRRGVPLKTIQAQLGHSSPGITGDFYLHEVSEDRERAGVEWSEEIAPFGCKVNDDMMVRKIHPLDFGPLIEKLMRQGVVTFTHHLGSQECTVNGRRYRLDSQTPLSTDALISNEVGR